MKPTSRRAFTLVEIMMASTILLLVVAATMSVFVAVNRSMYGLSDAIDLNVSTRLTQERVLYDLRAVSKVTESNLLTFTGEYVDYNTGLAGTLTYTLTGGKLVRKVALTGKPETTTVVMEGLVTDTSAAITSRFLYRNRTGSKDVLTTTATEVRAVQIEFVTTPTARQARGLVTGRNANFTSALIQLRNVAG